MQEEGTALAKTLRKVRDRHHDQPTINVNLEVRPRKASSWVGPESEFGLQNDPCLSQIADLVLKYARDSH
jgi:hypothetical protein